MLSLAICTLKICKNTLPCRAYSYLYQHTHRGRDYLHILAANAGCCFNSRARKGRDCRDAIWWRAFRCFNSRARKGRDSAKRITLFKIFRFNSRARKGRDSIWFYLSIFLCLQRFFCEIQKIFISYIAYFILFFATCLISICAKSLAFFAHL